MCTRLFYSQDFVLGKGGNEQQAKLLGIPACTACLDYGVQRAGSFLLCDARALSLLLASSSTSSCLSMIGSLDARQAAGRCSQSAPSASGRRPRTRSAGPSVARRSGPHGGQLWRRRALARPGPRPTGSGVRRSGAASTFRTQRILFFLSFFLEHAHATELCSSEECWSKPARNTHTHLRTRTQQDPPCALQAPLEQPV